MTKFFEFKKPVSSVRVAKEGAYTAVTIFIKGQNAGKVLLSEEESKDFIKMFIESEPVITRVGCGGGQSDLIFEQSRKPDDDTWLVSERGEIVRFSDI